MSKNNFLVGFLILVMFFSCKDNSKKESPKINKQPIDTLIEKNIDSDINYNPTDDEIREYGIIELVDDYGYPFYVITVNFIERNFKIDFNVNVENINLNTKQLYDLQGKYATIYYTIDLENSLTDLHFNGKTLFGKYAPKLDPKWEKITGILSGADEITPGDLPGKITITKSDGEKISFDLHIDKETVNVNGKEVTGYYTLKEVNNITHIVKSKN